MPLFRFIAFFLLLVAPGLVAANTPYRVLILHSYHAGLAWTDAVQRGIEQSVDDSHLDISLHVEHMDSLRFKTQLDDIRKNLQSSLQTKFGSSPPHAILVSDNDALDFVIAERASLFPETPIVYCGINGLSAYPPAQLEGMTGVAEAASFDDTLAVMNELFPGRRILVIGDQSATFRGNLDGLRLANQQRAKPASIEVFNQPQLSRIEARLRLLDKDSMVFFMARPIDDQGKPVAIPRAVRAVSTASAQPVFSGWEFMLGHGIVGGRLVSGEAQGLRAGLQLIEALKGTPVSAIPVLRESPNRYLFDYRELQRHGVENAILPEASTVIGRPVSFYEANREEVLITAVVFLTLLLIMAMLTLEIVRRRRAEVQLGYIATHDPLTGLTNRSLLADRFQQAKALAVRNDRAVACLFLDLDHFKEINDSLGHSVGDSLLRAVAERLASHVRESDTICRIGGDEFVILLNDLEQGRDAAATAEQVIDTMQKPFPVTGNALTISFSIGISTFPNDGQDFETLLKNADIAMYQAKCSGRNNSRFYDASMNALIQRRSQIHQLLIGAHARGEMSLHIQPQQCLTNGSIIGAEALLRWNSPELGDVSPAEFIPVAESSGQIIVLGAWVFEEGCRLISAWQKAGYPAIPLAINVSVAQLRRPDFAQFVGRMLAKYTLAPTSIEVEITESVFMEEVSCIDTNLQSLKAMGILLAIDDFGTGYSNLSNLKRTGAGRLKIDRAFVNGVVGDANDAAIVRAVVQVGRSLGMKTIAEGVETQSQADLLKAIGCNAMQGYLLSKPVTMDAFRRFLARSEINFRPA